MKRLTVKKIEEEIKIIKDHISDPEAVGCMESNLHEKTLQAIAEGQPNPAKLATAALKTREINATRWHA